MSNFNKEALDRICEQILNSSESLSDDLISKIENLYEEALIAQFLNERQRVHEALEQRIVSRLKEAPKPTPQKAEFTEIESEKPLSMGDEVKVLPHPEGPPKPQPRPTPTVEAPIETKEATTEEVEVSAPAAPEVTEPPKEVVDALNGGPSQSDKGSRLANLNIGLNDRIAFVKQLFMGSQEDYQRVISQINTMEDYDESIAFIQNVVKPDYDWAEYEETEQRLLDLVGHRFNKI